MTAGVFGGGLVALALALLGQAVVHRIVLGRPA
jgi:hypothetical protein